MTTFNRQALGQDSIGCPVYSRDGAILGHVKALSEHHFKVDAPLRPDYWLRYAELAAVSPEGVIIVVDKDHLHGVLVGDPEFDTIPAAATGTTLAPPPDTVPTIVPSDYVPPTGPDRG